MVHRCHNEKHMKFRNYGEKGIIVCKEWRNYSNFKKWALENGYDPSLQIDRMDSDGNYEPSNCRFVTIRENLLNRKNTKLITAFGETKAMSQWVEDIRCLVKDQTFRQRIRSNWTPEIALTKKADFGNRCRI